MPAGQRGLLGGLSASRGSYIRVYKIITFKQQWFACSLGECISEAIAKIQLRGMSGAFAEIPVSFARDSRLSLGDRLDNDACLMDEFIEPSARNRIPASIDNDGRFEEIRG